MGKLKAFLGIELIVLIVSSPAMRQILNCVGRRQVAEASTALIEEDIREILQKAEQELEGVSSTKH